MNTEFWQIYTLIISALAHLPAFWALPKIGKSPWLALLLIIPIVGYVFIYILAFGKWKSTPHRVS